jgi:hypothetical protein
MAMLGGATDAIFDEVCFNLPTLADLYKFAARDAWLRERVGGGWSLRDAEWTGASK